MRFAYADPPYLGQGKRYAHLHPDAHVWDNPATHVALVERLEDEYPDGWAISLSSLPESLCAYVGPGREVAVWVRPGSSGVGAHRRMNNGFEFVLYRTSVLDRRTHGPCVNDYLILPRPSWQHQRTHTGTKPPEFCAWVLDLLGYNPNEDELVDLFPGEGSMTLAAAQHRLILWDPTNAARKRGPNGSNRTRLPSRAQDTLPL